MKLHEALGSQTVMFTQAEKVRADLLNTFEKKRHHFNEKIVTYNPDAENAQEQVEEQSALQTTVPQELKWISGILAKALDSEATIDEGNTAARADVTLENGTILLRALPATQLMQLDKRLGELLTFVQAIPTLDPTKGFTPDPQRGHGVYKARTEKKRRTKKEQVAITLLAPTPEHPGQAQLITKDIEVGTITAQEWSGMLTPDTKGQMLERLEEVRRAVKQARARANDIDVTPVEVGRPLLDYLFAPALTGDAK